MSKLIMLCGLSGSGKSSIAKKLAEEYNAIIIASDAIRKELYGSEEIQDDPQKVFNLMHKRIKEHLTAGTNVIYDATNLISKRRKATINEFKRILDIECFCVVITATLEECIKRNSLRDRKVPEYVIERQLKSFEFPMIWEGWTSKPFIYQNTNLGRDWLKLADKKLRGLSQKGKYHLEDADVHTKIATEHALRYDDADITEAVRYHDIGKAYTRTEDEEGNSHFYGHEHVSAYIYATTLPQGVISDNNYNIVSLIQYHDISWKKNSVEENFSEKFRKDLEIMHECDMKGTLQPEDLKNISLMDFIDFFPDYWQEKLSKDPFNVAVKKQDEYVLLKYNQIDSDFSYRVVQESRGCILKNFGVSWEYVCRPFDKFFNYGEVLASDIDWNTATVSEKVDGSLMKLWFDDGKWHLSTNSTIDAFSAQVSDFNISFGEIFERALGKKIDELGKDLAKDTTYLFELTSPETRVVIPYEDGVYFLCAKHTATGIEDRNKPPSYLNIKYPKTYALRNINDVISAAANLTKDEEGYVVADAEGKRIKVKSPEYLIAAHLIQNHACSNKTLLSLILEEKIDDFVAYAPEYDERVNRLKDKIIQYEKQLEGDWERVKKYNTTRKEFALAIKEEKEKGYLFKKASNPELKATTFIKEMSVSALYEKISDKKLEDSNESNFDN